MDDTSRANSVATGVYKPHHLKAFAIMGTPVRRWAPARVAVVSVTAIVVSCADPPTADLPPCYVHPETFESGLNVSSAPSLMSMENNQKYCAIRFFRSYGSGKEPYREGTVLRPPAHGTVVVNRSASEGARFWYRPAPGFVGEDYFQIQFPAGTRWIKVNVRAVR